MTRVMPSTIIAGDTFELDVTSAEYPSTDAWTLCLALRGKMPVDITASGNVDGTYTVSALYTSTRQYPPGNYLYVLYVANPTEQYTIETGRVDVVARADLSRSTDVRTHARKVLDAVEATLEGRATSDQLSYTIGTRSLQRTPLEELLKLRDFYKEEVAREEAKLTGKSTKNKVKYQLNVQ